MAILCTHDKISNKMTCNVSDVNNVYLVYFKRIFLLDCETSSHNLGKSLLSLLPLGTNPYWCHMRNMVVTLCRA